ncbi:MAG: phosphoglucomutase [Olegusella sp.]|nr:phosphoglucomutase [Olegusella sp.]
MAIIRFTPYGWRGRFDEDFNEANIVRIAAAFGGAWVRRNVGDRIYVGYDGRYRGEAFALLAGSVLASFGLDVKVAKGVCPLPALAWTAAHDDRCAGVFMLSASESPCEYGGVIARRADGGPLPPTFLRDVERLMMADPLDARGEVERVDVMDAYLAHLATLVDLDLIGKARLRVVLDPMYGAVNGYLYKLLEQAGCSVTELHGEPREDFGGIHPEPVEPWTDECEQVVVCQHADIGLVLDGDGDRATLVDERGRLVSPHNLTPLILGHLVEGRGERGRVVTTLASSVRLTLQAERLGLPVTCVPVGFDRIYGELLEDDVLMGAEEYGGICLPSHLWERDGILVCLLALEMLARADIPLSEMVDGLADTIGRLDYTRRDIRLDAAAASSLDNILPGLNPAEVAGMSPVAVNHAEGLRLSFEDGSWTMLRPSRNAYMVRVYAEAPTREKRDALVDAMAEIARDPRLWRSGGDSEK